MVRPPVHCTHHHVFNPMQQFPFGRTTVAIKGITFSDTAMLDPTCSACFVLISHLSEEVRKHRTHSDIHVKGMTSSITALGELNCDLTIGSHNSTAFKEISGLILSAITPVPKYHRPEPLRRICDQQPEYSGLIQMHVHLWPYDTHNINYTSSLVRNDDPRPYMRYKPSSTMITNSLWVKPAS